MYWLPWPFRLFCLEQTLPSPIFLYHDFHIMIQILESRFLSFVGPFSAFSSDFPLFQDVYRSVKVPCSSLLYTKHMVNWVVGKSEPYISPLSMKNSTGYLSWLITQADWQGWQSCRGEAEAVSWNVSDVTPCLEPVLSCSARVNVLVCADLPPFVHFPLRLMACLCKAVVGQKMGWSV